MITLDTNGGGYASFYYTVLLETGLDPPCLQIEILEKVALEDLD